MISIDRSNLPGGVLIFQPSGKDSEAIQTTSPFLFSFDTWTTAHMSPLILYRWIWLTGKNLLVDFHDIANVLLCVLTIGHHIVCGVLGRLEQVPLFRKKKAVELALKTRYSAKKKSLAMLSTYSSKILDYLNVFWILGHLSCCTSSSTSPLAKVRFEPNPPHLRWLYSCWELSHSKYRGKPIKGYEDLFYISLVGCNFFILVLKNWEE